MIGCDFLIPGDLATPTGGYAYARRIMPLLAANGVAVRHVPLPASFPAPGADDLATSARTLAGVPPHRVAMIDGLAYGAMSEDVIAHSRAPILALVHHPLGLESGLPKADSERLLAGERRALRLARQIVATSQTTADTLVDLMGCSRADITIAEPGTERAARAIGSTDGPTRLVSVGSVVPRKGFDVLVAALARLRDLPWVLIIAGSLDRDGRTATALREQIAAAGLADRITLTGAVNEAQLGELYAAADLFVLASRYEGYGMVFAEAMARGLPIIATAGGAVAATVPATAGLVVPAGDIEALSDALRMLMRDHCLRARLSDGAFAHAQHLPTWDDTAARVALAIRRAAGAATPEGVQ